MVERLETDFQHRLQAGAEAIELLDRAGFLVSDADVEIEDAVDSHFNLEVSLAVGEMTRPLEALEDEPDADLGAGFALGAMVGLIAADPEPCDVDGCPRDDE